MMLLVLLGLFVFALGLVNSNWTRRHQNNLKHKSPVNGVQLAGEYDPSNFINPTLGDTYASKGAWLNCLFPMSEEEANKAEPKASTKFKGTLESMHLDYVNLYICCIN